jgi:3-dehydroquinate dehydratase/shikimate dehydrogenase
VYGVVGWPVTQSRGPLIHNAALRSAGLDAVYLPLPVAPSAAEFDAFMEYVTANAWLDIDGLSVTVPHKEHALRWLERRGGEIDRLALRCGAVNTLARRGDAWIGANTDAPAIADVLRDAAGPGRPGDSDDVLRGRAAGVIGAGGAGRAALAALADLGCPITVCNRDAKRGAAVAAEFGASWLPWERRAELHACDILIQCTKVGMWPGVGESPLPAAALRKGQLVLDTVYRPRVTRLLADAERVGATAVCGLEMFLAQAQRQFALWTRRTAPLAEWRAILAAQKD